MGPRPQALTPLSGSPRLGAALGADSGMHRVRAVSALPARAQLSAGLGSQPPRYSGNYFY